MTTFWTIYYLVGLVWILAPEITWLIENPQYTFSERLWSLEHLDFRHPWNVGHWSDVHWAVALIVWLLFAWLSVHIPAGWLR